LRSLSNNGILGTGIEIIPDILADQTAVALDRVGVLPGAEHEPAIAALGLDLLPVHSDVVVEAVVHTQRRNS
jgi:hypothetical protein